LEKYSGLRAKLAEETFDGILIVNLAVDRAAATAETTEFAFGNVVDKPLPALLHAVPLSANVAARTGRVNFFTYESLSKNAGTGSKEPIQPRDERILKKNL
jgi:hypothetical protein